MGIETNGDGHGVVQAFLDLVERKLGLDPVTTRRYSDLLARRLDWLLAQAHGAAAPPPEQPADVRLARRVVRAIEGDWHDGDENLVRGWLDGPGAETEQAAAQLLLHAVEELVRIEPRSQTVRFFLWAMESALAGYPRRAVADARRRG